MRHRLGKQIKCPYFITFTDYYDIRLFDIQLQLFYTDRKDLVNPRRCRIREKNGRRSFAIADVPTVEEAVALLNNVLSLETI